MSAPGATEPRVYLLDIEGTVAPISLVSEVLFPYARAHFPSFLKSRGQDADIQADMKLLAEESRAETDMGCPTYGIEITSDCESIAYFNWLMDRDRKSTALKSLQGKIWKSGFESGELKGTLFSDVPEVLARWAEKARVVIYSSGSVEAQRLLFRYATFGDLTPLISGYFDTRIGPKRASASYSAIAAALDVTPGEMIFFSDVVEELDAARDSGCRTQLVVREGNAPVEDTRGHPMLHSLDGIA